MSEKQSSSWEELPENNKTQVAASFLVSMETTGFNIADNLEEADSIVSSNENLCTLLMFFGDYKFCFHSNIILCEKKPQKRERKQNYMYHSFFSRGGGGGGEKF